VVVRLHSETDTTYLRLSATLALTSSWLGSMALRSPWLATARDPHL